MKNNLLVKTGVPVFSSLILLGCAYPFLKNKPSYETIFVLGFMLPGMGGALTYLVEEAFNEPPSGQGPGRRPVYELPEQAQSFQQVGSPPPLTFPPGSTDEGEPWGEVSDDLIEEPEEPTLQAPTLQEQFEDNLLRAKRGGF